MCNIAAYVGNRDAAPILIDMMAREEAFAGGFYTGLATIYEGNIYHKKLTGDLETLLKKTDARGLKGNIGLIHSRSKSGGGDAWSHPFIGRGGNCAYVANGAAGIFKDRIPEYTAIADKLLADGYGMALEEPVNASYPTVSSGMSVHMSDVMAQLIASKLDADKFPMSAIGEAFCEMPSEIVGLMIDKNDADTIYFARINMPMWVAFCDHGAYLASTPLAFPDDARDLMHLPALSYGAVGKEHIVIKKLDTPVCSVAPITEKIRQQAYKMFCERLDGTNMRDIEKMVEPLFDRADAYQEPSLLYEVLYRLKNEGRLKIETRLLDGVIEGTGAPKNFMSIC